MKKLIFLFCLLLSAFLLVNFTTATIPSRCSFSPEIDCIESIIHANDNTIGGSVTFTFKNNMGSSADFIINMIYFGDKSYVAVDCASVNESLSGVLLSEVREVKCIFNEGIFPVGDKAKFEVDTLVKKSNDADWFSVKGEIYAIVYSENDTPERAVKRQNLFEMVMFGITIVILLLSLVSIFVLIYYFFKKSNNNRDRTVLGIASLIISFAVCFFIFVFFRLDFSPVGDFSILFLFLLLPFFIWKAHPVIRKKI